MTTARDIIYRAMRILGVTQSGENPEAGEAEAAKAALNGMLNGWPQRGIELEFLGFDSINDTVPYGDDHLSAIAYNLAIELAPEFGVQVPQEVVVRAGQYFSDLQKIYVIQNIRELSIDPALTPQFGVNTGLIV